MKKIRSPDYRRDYFIRGRVSCDLSRFHRRLTFAKHVERLQAHLFQKGLERFRSERLVIIIDLLEINAVFTKQRSQIPAGRSRRFFVNGYFIHF